MSRIGGALKYAAILLTVAIAALLLYGGLIEPRFVLDERRYRVVLPGLPEQWSGSEVAVFSDLQVGMWLANSGMVARVVEEVVGADPEVVLLAGDFVYHTETAVDDVTELLAPLVEAGIPTYAVLGNHDYASGAAEELTDALEDQGIDVLRNEAVALRRYEGTGGSGHLHIVGVGSARYGHSDPIAAMRAVPDGAPRVVLMHNPASFRALPAGSAPLAVAGHTHCGQIALPGTPAWSHLELLEDERVVVGGFAPDDYGAPGNRLFVTCGIGFSRVPIRINAAPQVVYFELTAP